MSHIVGAIQATRCGVACKVQSKKIENGGIGYKCFFFFSQKIKGPLNSKEEKACAILVPKIAQGNVECR